MPDSKTAPTRFQVPDIASPASTELAVKHLQVYFGLTGQLAYTGAHFERLAGGGDRAETRNVLCPDDLVAVTMLSVQVNPTAALTFLEEKSTEITSLLQLIPADSELVDAPDEFFRTDSRAHSLWRLFNSEPGIGWVIAGKLLARKRPKLIPVFDRVVKSAVGGGDQHWQWLSHALAANGMGLHNHLGDIRETAGVGEDISIIRVFDVIVWMQHRHDIGGGLEA